ncbi:MAG: type IV pilus assembly protein [Desulfobulbaceae bacterium]|nr:MAG: type IV pilus assembly protein [Desulfobulbaceae bacterium]
MKLIHSNSLITKTLSNRGFTLVEIMIALAISGIVMAAIYSVYISQQRTSIVQEQVVEMQQNVRASLDIMEREIRMAGYSRSRTGATIPNVTITTANANQLIFRMVADTDGMDNDGSGVADEDGEIESIEYYLYDAYGDGDLDLGRRTPSNTQAVAENIDAIEFNYIMANGTLTTTPAQPNDVRAVQISILARAGREDREFTNSITYTSGSGNAAWDINGATAGTGNPPNDNFRRRLLITTVQCRNMGLN